jgi:dTMP kinase
MTGRTDPASTVPAPDAEEPLGGPAGRIAGSTIGSPAAPVAGTDPVLVSSAAKIRSVLRGRDFRRLWLVMSFSSFGDWLGLLATTALAAELADG